MFIGITEVSFYLNVPNPFASMLRRRRCLRLGSACLFRCVLRFLHPFLHQRIQEPSSGFRAGPEPLRRCVGSSARDDSSTKSNLYSQSRLAQPFLASSRSATLYLGSRTKNLPPFSCMVRMSWSVKRPWNVAPFGSSPSTNWNCFPRSPKAYM